jgi:DnaJ-class molecular chaperone
LTAADAGRDPYKTLGVSRDASDAELRAAYRRLARLHHPDHNGGSLESTRRFEAVQEAYAKILAQRKTTASRPAEDPELDARIASMERDLRDAYLARERALRAAREAAADRFVRPTDEELGYVTTDDSFSKIFADAAEELSKLFSEARERSKP